MMHQLCEIVGVEEGSVFIFNKMQKRIQKENISLRPEVWTRTCTRLWHWNWPRLAWIHPPFQKSGNAYQLPRNWAGPFPAASSSQSLANEGPTLSAKGKPWPKGHGPLLTWDVWLSSAGKFPTTELPWILIKHSYSCETEEILVSSLRSEQEHAQGCDIGIGLDWPEFRPYVFLSCKKVLEEGLCALQQYDTFG